MDEYKKPYFSLFNAASDALEELERGRPAAAARILKEGQQRAEKIFVEWEA